MPDNLVLFHFRGSPWTLGGACVALAVLLLLAWLILLPIVLSRFGASKRMATAEAERRAFVGREVPHQFAGPTISGPAAGVEWSYEFTIGGFRRLWQQGARSEFYLLPAYGSMFALAFFFGGVGLAFVTRTWLFLTFSAFSTLWIGLIAFMMWAAVNTQLE